ncbi:MAG: c-type cytochrome [Gemmatimonadaceae bacterium]
MNARVNAIANARVNARAIRSLLAVAPFMLSLSACEWFTDFKRQPSLSTWEPTHCDVRLDVCNDKIPSRGNPLYSVSVYGTARPAFVTSYAPLPAVIDSMSDIPNPTAVTETSLNNGHKYFSINCAVCHGDRGMGDGPATKYGMIGINLTGDLTKNRTDGYIFGMIRDGRGAMPTYNRIEEMDRWDVVNYVRALQGKVSIPVAVGPLALPGVTGRWVPGATLTAPTRPSPFIAPARGSAAAWYPSGGAPPQLDMRAPRVGPPLLNPNVYRSGVPNGSSSGNASGTENSTPSAPATAPAAATTPAPANGTPEGSKP